MIKPRKPRIGRCALLMMLACLAGICGVRTAQAQNFSPQNALPTDRGRVHVDTSLGYPRLLTDKNTQLRGVSMSWDGGAGYGPVLPSQSDMNAIANVYGLNMVHVYLEHDAGIAAGYNETVADQLIDEASKAGLYVIITVGGTAGGTSMVNFDKSFWSIYAPHYASRTNVIYEIQNEPQWYGPGNWGQADWDTQVTLYKQIRAAAPNTHILTCTFMGFDNAGAAAKGITYMANNGVDWSNASVAFHGYSSLSSIDSAIGSFNGTANMPPLTCTEWDPSASNTYIPTFERHHTNWAEFVYLNEKVADLDGLKQLCNNDGISWAPDFGTWPTAAVVTQPNLIEGDYEISPVDAPSLCLDVWGSDTTPGAAIDQYTWAGNRPNQIFHAHSLGNGVYWFEPRNAPGSAIDVYGGGGSIGNFIDSYPYGFRSNQQWTVTPSGNGYRMSPLSAPTLALEQPNGNTSPSLDIRLNSASGSTPQQWSFTNQSPIGHCIAVQSMANNLYITNNLINTALTVGAYWATSIGTWEKFDVVDAGNGMIGLKSLSNGDYVSTNLGNKDYLQAAWATSIGGWEQFQWVGLTPTTMALKSPATGYYVTADLNNGGQLTADHAQSPLWWETFTWSDLGPAQ